MALFRRILVPHDFSDHATRALRMAAGLAGPQGKIVVLHVVAPFYGGLGFASPEEMAWTPSEDLVTSLERRLERLVQKALPSSGGPRVECRVVLGEPLSGILEAAASGIDSIVMTTIGRTGLAHLVIGSVAEKVVRHAPVPVLTFHPGKRATRGSGTKRRAKG